MSNAKHLRDLLDQDFPQAYELDVGSEGTTILVVVHESFAGQSRSERLGRVEPLIMQTGLTPGVTDLYTPVEAADRSVALAPPSTLEPANWEQAVSMIASGTLPIGRTSNPRKLRRIVFYSYKGGVGRTTAMVHTAFHLARAGQRVAVVDMDVEAPDFIWCFRDLTESRFLWDSWTIFGSGKSGHSIRRRARDSRHASFMPLAYRANLSPTPSKMQSRARKSM